MATSLLTRNDALTAIAQASFYEYVTITAENGMFQVDNKVVNLPDIGYLHADGSLGYDTAEDLHSTKLMEPCETFTEARHIDYQFGEIVSELEDGQSLSFTYVPIDMMDCPDCTDQQNDCQCDLTVGWTLVAR